MNDCILSYHTESAGCGVAKFNQQLAARLKIPCLPMWAPAKYPLVSLKFAENPGLALTRYPQYDVFLHDWHDTHDTREWLAGASKVFAADPLIAESVKALRQDARVLWCPSTLHGQASRGGLRVLLFGMAHKVNRGAYLALAKLLHATAGSYTVSLSTGIHEGHPWDASWREVQTVAAEAFGPHLRMLGYLGDDALAVELRQASVCGLFFSPGARANNTSLWAAMDASCPVITTLDTHSPPELVHGETVFDLSQLERFPTSSLVRVGRQGHDAAKARGWAALMEAFHRD